MPANDNHTSNVITFPDWDSEETGEDALADMAGASVEFKGRVNKYHRFSELLQEYTARLLAEWERR